MLAMARPAYPKSDAPVSVTVVVLENFPPYYLTNKGRPAGLAVDVLGEVARRAGLDINYRIVKNWSDGYRAIRSGKADIFPNVGISDKRREFLDFSMPYDVFYMSLFAREGARKNRNLNDFAGKTLGVQATNVLIQKLQAENKFNIKTYATFEEAFLALLKGDVDAVPAPDDTFKEIARKTGLEDRIVTVGKPLLEVKRAMAVKKGNEVLLKRINVALKTYTDSADYQKILNKWHGTPMPFWTVPRVAGAMATVFVVFILLVAGWRFHVSRKLSKTEQQLSRTEARFKDFAEASSDWFWEMDAGFRFTYFSPRFEDITGYKIADWIGKRRWENINQPYRDEEWETHLQDLKARRPFRNYVFFLGVNKDDRDGLFVSTSGMPFYDENGTFLGYRGSSTNITEQVRAEQELSRSEKRFKDFAEASGDWFWEMDADLKFTYFSSRFEEVTGFNIEQRLGTKRWDYANLERDKDLWARHKADLEARRPFRNFEFYSELEKAGNYYLSVSGVPVFDDNGTFAGYRGTCTDVTERRLSEERRRLSEDRLRIAMMASNAGYWMRDVPLTKVFWSEENFRLLGYEPGEVEASYENWIGRIHPDDRDKAIQQLENCIHDQTDIDMEYRVNLPDGTIRWIHNVGKNLLGPDGQSRVLAGVQTDITDRVHLQHQLGQSQRMEAVGQLTGGVAHDFNNLLGIMMGNAELLKYSLDGDDKAVHHVKSILAAIDKAASLTSRLLSFSRKQALSPVTADLTELISGLDDMLSRALGEPVDLKIVHGDNLWDVLIDVHQFENALVNLALNARDAMPNGGVLTIESENITLDESYTDLFDDVVPGDYVCVAVSDNGTGMIDEVAEKAFEPFFTTKDVGQGSGLGLSMVYGFVKQSGGHITVYSELGQGTTIKLYLPRSLSENTNGEIFAIENIPEQGTERILIVEDDDGVREIPVAILGAHGYHVTEARDGMEAIKLLKQLEFDLLFTDVVLPGGVNGVDIAEEAQRLQPGIRVLYTTGYSENAVVHDGKLDEGVELLSKPYRRNELLEKVRAQLDTKP